jgi:hypothetical protein
MKNLLVIFLIALPIFVYSQGSGLIELHPRIGDTLTLEKRDYFGLFPNIEQFNSATLQKTSGKEYVFNISFADRIYQKVVDDSVVVALRYYIDNYEDLINQNRTPDKKFERYLIPDFVTISTFYRTNIQKLKIKLLDKSEIEEYLVYHNDSCLILSNKNNVNSFRNLSDFRIINFNEIDTAFNIKYGIIKGKNFVFVKNFEILDSLSMFYQNGEIMAPEIKNLLKANKIKSLQTDNLEFDFDQPYLTKFSLSLNNSFQLFYVDKFILVPSVKIWLENQYIIQTGVDFGYRIIDPLKVLVGINYGQYVFKKVLSFSKTQFNITSLNLGLDYNLWHQDKYRFNSHQFLFDIFANIFIQKYSYNYGEHIPDINKSVIDEYDFTRNYKFMYQGGLKLDYLYNHNFFTSLSTNFNYYNDLGLISPDGQLSTRYINFFITYGINLTFGIQI